LSKIIIIGPAYPLRGGLATFDERLARQFMNEGHEVIIYTFSLQYPNFLFPGKTQYSESDPPEDLNIKVCINSVNPINWIKVGKQLKNENADKIIVRYWIPFMGPCLGTILRFASRNKETKIIGIIDNAVPHEKRFGDRFFTKYFIAGLHGFVTMSESVKQDLKQFTVKNIHIVQHPLYDNFGQKIVKSVARDILKIENKKYVFLFFGFIRNYKGLDLLIEALEFVHSDFVLLIAGEFYAGEDEIKTKIESSKSKDRILCHTHFIKDEEVAVYFSASDCVVQPYRNATQSGVTPLAYYFEVPMIVTNVGALPSLVPPSLGKVCEPNPASIASAMNAMQDFDIGLFESSIATEKKKLSWENLSSVILHID
jgi:glycosyltransferase involved in cell wall biosynthesis